MSKFYLKVVNFLSIITVSSLIIFYIIPLKSTLLICLFLVSCSYGGIISIFPSMINKIYGISLGIRIFGFVFTGWGVFGFFVPFLAGWTFEIFATYSFIILFVVILSIIPIIIIKIKHRKFLNL